MKRYKKNLNPITPERQLVHMLALRMRRASREYEKAKGTARFRDAQAVFIEANNAYQVASQMLYNYKGLYPRMAQ